MKARERSQMLITQLANHIELLHTDHTKILNYISSLEDLVEEYRDFASRSKPTTTSDMAIKLQLLDKTAKLIGPVPKELQPEKEETPIYLFEVDRDEAEKRGQ